MIRAILAASLILMALLFQAGPLRSGEAMHRGSPPATFQAADAGHDGSSADHHGTHHGHRNCGPLSSCMPPVLIDAGVAARPPLASGSWPIPAAPGLASRTAERDPPVPRAFA